MAFPSVRSSSEGTNVGTSFSPTMPAGIVAGDLILLVATCTNAVSFTGVTGYAKLENIFWDGTGTTRESAVFARVATGDSSDDITITTSGTAGITAVAFAVQDWEGTIVDGVDRTAWADGSDPASLSPAWGSADTLWIEAIGSHDGTEPAVSAWSTGFTEIDQIFVNISVDNMSGAAYRQEATATKDPASISTSGGGTFRVLTLAVRPAGAAGITGTIAATETDDTMAASGAVAISGTIAATEEDDTAAAAGAVLISGTVAATEENDTIAASGGVLISGSITVTEADDTMAASGSLVASITGSIAATEEDDTAVATGSVVISGSIAVTEEDDTMAANDTARVDIVVVVSPPTTHWAVSPPETHWATEGPRIT